MSYIAIVGSREYGDMEAVRAFVRSLPKGTTVVSGGARGVDSVAEDEAGKCQLNLLIHRADWKHLGKSAGFIRNQEIVSDADEIVAFWDGKSRGTKHTIGLAKLAGKLVRVNPT